MTFQITIDGQALDVDQGATILQAARQHDLYIPTLCDYPGLPAHGSCRMCIVEIQGRPNTPTACTTPAEPGMQIQTNSPRVQALRAELLHMLLADHPASCLFCSEESHCDECMLTLHKAGVTTGCRSCAKDGQCELQKLVEKIAPDGVNYPPRYRMLKVEKNDPFFDRDYNLCVLCGRCVRTCEALHFAGSIAYAKRGTQTVVGTAFNRSHLASSCTFCGACVEVCPTGALSEKTRKWDGEPELETATTCPLCSLGCQIRLLSKNGRVIGSLPDHPAGATCLCVKGRFGFSELVNHPTRLSQPQKAAAGLTLKISWEETLRLAAEKLSGVSPERFEMLVSPNCSLESLYVAQKFTRHGLKSNNIHIHSVNGYAQSAGEVFDLLRLSQPLSTLAGASTILCLGLDNKYSQAVVEVNLHHAQLSGASLVAALCEEDSLGRFAELWLHPGDIDKSGLLSALVEQIGRLSAAQKEAGRNMPGPLEQAAGLLVNSTCPVIIAGPAIFNHPDRRVLLKAILSLVQACKARLVALPPHADLVSLCLGIPCQTGQADGPDPEVLYLLGDIYGEQPIPGHPFIVYQNIYPPAPGLAPDLILPAAAFSEEDGSLIDYTGRVKTLRRAVAPPGQALPAWEILCRIAQQMGLEGFDFNNLEDIRAEMAGLPGFCLADGRVNWPAIPRPAPAEGEKQASFDPQPVPETYMGYPLTQFIQGLKQLAPEKTRRKHG